MLTVMPVHYISIILSPFTKLLSVSTKLVLKLLRMQTEDQRRLLRKKRSRRF